MRMKPFQHLVLPEFIPYDAFHDAVTQPRDSTVDLLAFAAAAASRARKDFELVLKVEPATARCVGTEGPWRENVRACLRSCIAVAIACAGVGRGVGDLGGGKGKGKGVVEGMKLEVEIPKVESAYHEWWIVPKVTVGKS